MPETRSTKQYKVFTLHANVDIVVGKKDGEEITRTDRVPVAVFDDAKKLSKFQKENSAKLKGQTGYEVVEDWVEFEPKADRFGLPFNPAPQASTDEVEGDNDTNSNGTN